MNQTMNSNNSLFCKIIQQQVEKNNKTFIMPMVSPMSVSVPVN